MTDLVKAGVMLPVKATDDNSGLEDPNLSDPEDSAQADREFIDRAVQQAEWGHAKPNIGLEEF